MAKNSNSSSGPEVSSLPIKQDESPLVIDLPDGQKLVVGHLSNGSVIEVATWRGTGRPDSRTSRLMLGMSSASEATEKVNGEAAATKPAKKFSVAQVFEQVTSAIAQFKQSRAAKVPKIKAKKEKTAPDAEASTPFIQTVTPASTKTSADTDVDEWLNSILAKSEAKASKSSTETSTKPKPKAAPKKAAVRKASPKSATRRSR